MEKNTTTLETGTSSAAVNELILYTDNTRELAEKRDKIYQTCLDGIIDPYNMRYHFHYDMAPLAARGINYKGLTFEETKEYASIYAHRYDAWKKEKELEPYNEYRQAKLYIGEEPMTFEQWKAAENDLSDYDTK